MLLNKLAELIDHRKGIQIAFALRFAPGEEAVTAEHDSIASRVLKDGAAHHHGQLKARALPRHPHKGVLEGAIELLHLFFAVGGCRHSDGPVGMQMIDVAEREETVERRIDRGDRGVHAESAKGVEIHNRVFLGSALVLRFDGEQLVEIKRGKTGAFDAAQVAATAFDPQDVGPLPGQWVGLLDLRACVATTKVGNAQVGSQQIGAIAQQLGLVELCGCFFIPQVLQIAQGS